MAWLSVDKFTESRSVKKWVEHEFYAGHRVFDRRAAFITSMLAGDDPTGMLKTVPYGTVAVNMADKKVWIHDATTDEWYQIAGAQAAPRKEKKYKK